MIFYKKRYWIFWTVSIFITLFFISFKFILPMAKDAAKEKDKELIFSRESGFYEEPFALELSAETGTIYYTLDGSLPDKNSIKYEKPILIEDATPNDNIYSERTDVSAGFDREEIERISSESWPGYQIPNYKVDKATIIRAVVCDAAGNYSKVKSASYFVGFSKRSGYEGMKILSIITEPSNLFGYETGIYVTGKTYDEYKRKHRDTGEFYWREEFWTLWQANYRNRGIKWERKSQCQFFDETGQLVLEQVCGIRIHGGSSRGYNPKSLNIYARKEYDGNQSLQEDLFGTGYYASAVTLFQGGNDTETKAKDYLISAAINDLNVSTMHFEPYLLFLNGEYWGVYWLNEKFNADYLAYYYNVNKDNILMIKEGELAEGKEEDYKHYVKMVEFCSESDVTIDENYSKVCELIDIDSYLDYYAVMIYIGRNADWPSGNFALWRTVKREKQPYGDGKWRWIIFDLNSSGFSVDFNSIEYVMNNDKMFENLMTNDAFRTNLISRIEELAKEIIEFEMMDERLREYQCFMEEPMRRNSRRFYGDDSLAEFYEGIENLRVFFRDRYAYLSSITKDNAGV